jgi:hypothetical protein
MVPGQRRCRPPASHAAGDALDAITTVRAGVRQWLLPEIAELDDAEDRFAAILH